MVTTSTFSKHRKTVDRLINQNKNLPISVLERKNHKNICRKHFTDTIYQNIVRTVYRYGSVVWRLNCTLQMIPGYAMYCHSDGI